MIVGVLRRLRGCVRVHSARIFVNNVGLSLCAGATFANQTIQREACCEHTYPCVNAAQFSLAVLFEAGGGALCRGAEQGLHL